MKQIVLLTTFLTFISFSSCELLENVDAGLSDLEIANGLKEALLVGTDSSVAALNTVDGYLADEAVKILLPEEVQSVQGTIEDVVPGARELLADVVVRLNRAAEDAASEATPIFVDAITGITITDARDILFGEDTAATFYLESNTREQLVNAYAPKINTSLDVVELPALWEQIANPYNEYANGFVGQALGAEPIPDDLGAYVTNKALDGLFLKVQDKEADIREDVNERVSDV
ncbi:MAG: DUF4197 domain-containing protein, partial [Bacteroidota bacterium]